MYVSEWGCHSQHTLDAMHARLCYSGLRTIRHFLRLVPGAAFDPVHLAWLRTFTHISPPALCANRVTCPVSAHNGSLRHKASLAERRQGHMASQLHLQRAPSDAACSRSWRSQPPQRRGVVPTVAAGGSTEVRVCTHTTCRKQGSRDVLAFFNDVVDTRRVQCRESGCLGNCGSGPNVLFLPDGTVGVRGSLHLMPFQCARGGLSSLGFRAVGRAGDSPRGHGGARGAARRTHVRGRR
jgi:hypothetical protein